jgi:hypothetical protein
MKGPCTLLAPRDSDLIGVSFARSLDSCRKRQYVYLICVLLYIRSVYCKPPTINKPLRIPLSSSWLICASEVALINNGILRD